MLAQCEPFANMNFEHQLQCNKVVRSRQGAGSARVRASDSIRKFSVGRSRYCEWSAEIFGDADGDGTPVRHSVPQKIEIHAGAEEFDQSGADVIVNCPAS